MDFLDPKKTRRHTFLLFAGYITIGIAIAIATIVLVYQANGFGVNRQGQVVQNGLLFFSSQPNPADIYLNNKRNPLQTNTRLSVAAGQYQVRLSREGYRDWQRTINVQGGDVQNFDYPFLFPSKLETTREQPVAEAPHLSTQSRDRRWLMTLATPAAGAVTLYDLEDPLAEPEELAIPTSIVTASNAARSWEAIQWADDNKHVLLRHTYGDQKEYILFDRGDMTKSVNLTKTLGVDPAELTLIDNKYDRYHVLSGDGVLNTTALGSPTPTPLISNVLAYKAYGTKTVLFATPTDAPEGKVNIVMQVDDKPQVIREVAANTTYLLDMAGYRGDQYVVVSAASEGKAYVYKDPLDQITDKVKRPSAIRAIRVQNPGAISFSLNAQYIAVQGGTQFGVYDIFVKRAYIYTLKQPMDTPQTKAKWMDGNRLTYVTGGKTLVFDYDRRNQQLLGTADPAHGSFFGPDYNYLYTLRQGEAAYQLAQTPLLTEQDL